MLNIITKNRNKEQKEYHKVQYYERKKKNCGCEWDTVECGESEGERKTKKKNCVTFILLAHGGFLISYIQTSIIPFKDPFPHPLDHNNLLKLEKL